MSKTTPEEAAELARKFKARIVCNLPRTLDERSMAVDVQITPEQLAALIDEVRAEKALEYVSLFGELQNALEEIDKVRGVDAEPVAWRGVHVEGDYLYYDEFPAVLSDEQRRQLHLEPLYTHPAPSQPAATKTSDEIGFMFWETAQPAAPVELPVVATALLQHALKLADRLPDSEIAYTLRLYLNGLTELPDCGSDAANAAIDKELAARNYPANSANAGRAGWEAARKFNLSNAQAAIAAGRKAS